MNDSEIQKLREATEYWNERCKEDPRAWTKHVLGDLGFSQEEIDCMERERVFRNKEKEEEEGRRFLRRLEVENQRDIRALRDLDIEIRQGLIKLMLKEGMKDEEIDARMATLGN